MSRRLPLAQQDSLRITLLAALALGGCTLSGGDPISNGTASQAVTPKTCGELGEEAGYMHDVMKCYRALDPSVPGCGWPLVDTNADGVGDTEDPNRWICDAMQRPVSNACPSWVLKRPISDHRWTLCDAADRRGHEWAVLNYDGQQLQPTVLNGQEECSVCLGYAQGGIHPLPPSLIAGLWQTSLGPIWNVRTYQGQAQVYECGTWEGSYQDNDVQVANLVSTKAHCRGWPSQAGPIEQHGYSIGFKPLGANYGVYEKDGALLGMPPFAAERTATAIEPFVLRGEWILEVTAVEESLEGLYPDERLRRILRGKKINAFRYDLGAGTLDVPVPQTGCHDPNPYHCTANANAQAVFALKFGDDGWPVLDIALTKPINISGKFSSGEIYVLNFFGFTGRSAEVAENGSMMFCDHVLIDSASGVFHNQTVTFGLGFCLRPAFSTPIQF